MQNKFQKLEQDNHFQIYKRYPITLVKGIGARVWDSEGNEYIDALGGIAVLATGHCHPTVVNAIKEQAEKLIHCSNLYYNEPQSILANKLTMLSGMDRVFFCNSGAEAIEGAIKLARRYAKSIGKTGPIYSFTNCFHGRTLTGVAMGKAKYQEGFEPIPEGFEMLEFNNMQALKSINKSATAVIIEPIQGEGGVVPADKEFMLELQKICRDNDILLIFDEIQCGIGRTGHFLAYQYYEVQPDIITVAKALGSGFPIGAVLAKEHIAASLPAGMHGTTFGGNPLACATANATLKVIQDEKLIEKAKLNGDYFMELLKEKTADIKNVVQVRGLGMMIGIELNFKCSDVVSKMLEKGVLANCAAEYTIRLLPPLVISREEIEQVVEILVESIKEIK